MKKKPKKLTLKEILPKYTVDDFIEDEDSEEYRAAEDAATADLNRRLATLQKYIERNLTKKERQAILHIVEEKSTKDEQGYITLYFSFIQAWKIYQAKERKRR